MVRNAATICSAASSSSSDRVEIVNFEQQAAVDGFERSVRRMRRSTGIGVGREAFAALTDLVVANGQIARDEIDLLPIVVGERRRCIDAGLETQQAGAGAPMVLFIESPGQDFLLNSR